MELSVHDNRLFSYAVRCQDRVIHLHTVYFDGEVPEYTDVIFTGVLVYHFEGDNLNTILFDIGQVPARDLYAEYREMFEELKDYAWPEIDYESEEDLFHKLDERQIQGFVIRSSYGMSGWIWAQAMQVQLGAAPDADADISG